MLRPLALLALAAQLAACASSQAEIVNRSLISHTTEQRRCDPPITAADLEPGWGATTVRPYTVERCEDVGVDRYETVKMVPTSDTGKTLASVAGAVGTTAIFAAVVFATGANQAPRNGFGPVESMAAVAAEIGTSALGAVAGQGVLRLYEKLKQTRVFDEERTPLDPVERNRRSIDGVLEVGAQRWTTQKAEAQISSAELLRIDPLALRLDGKPLRLDARKLSVAESCARSFAFGPPRHLEELAQPALTTALNDARECFEAGVGGAEHLYSKLLLEQMRRRMAATDGAHADAR